MRARDLPPLTEGEVWEAFHSSIEHANELIYHHQLADSVSFLLHPLLRMRLRIVYGEGAQQMEPKLITGLPGNLNTETNLDLARVAAGELDRETFLERYGHRGNPDWQVSTPRWREDPSRIDTMIRAVARADRDPVRQFEAQQRIRAESESLFAADLGRRWLLRPFRRSILRALRDYQLYSPLRETTQGTAYHFIELARYAALEAGRRTRLGDLVFFLTMEELRSALVDGSELRDRARERRRRWRSARALHVPHLIRSDDLQAIGRPPSFDPHSRTLSGQPVSSGTARGRALVVETLEEAQGLEPGEILIAASADPAWTPLFLVAGAVVLEQGGLLSHPAIVAREYGLPAVVNVPHVTRIVRTGQTVTVDAERGLVSIEEGAD
jgi:pyruvate,water dikinase